MVTTIIERVVKFGKAAAPTLGFTTLVVATVVGTVYVKRKLKEYSKHQQFSRDVLDNLGSTQELAMEVLEEEVPEPSAQQANVVANGMEYDYSPVKEKRHRRLPHRKTQKQRYFKLIVAECKAKLGTPKDNEANRMVIRYLLEALWRYMDCGQLTNKLLCNLSLRVY